MRRQILGNTRPLSSFKGQQTRLVTSRTHLNKNNILLLLQGVQQVHPPSLAANGPQGNTDIDPL